MSTPSAISLSPRSSGISLSGLLVASPPLLSSSEECHPLRLKTVLFSDYAQHFQPLPSAQVGFQPLVWGSGYSGVS